MKRIVPESDPEIADLCKDLLTQHRDAWRVLRQRLPSEVDDCHRLLGDVVCQALRAAHGGQWDFSLRRNRYASIFRPSWSLFGQYEADSLLDLSGSSGTTRLVPNIRFRLSFRPNPDDSERCTYIAKWKLDLRERPELKEKLTPVFKALQRGVPDGLQFTESLKTNTKLSPINEESELVPDRVVEWFVEKLSPVVKAMDKAFGKR